MISRVMISYFIAGCAGIGLGFNAYIILNEGESGEAIISSIFFLLILMLVWMMA